MDKPKQINMIRRLILSFSILVLIFVLFGLYVFYGIHTASELTHKIYNHPLVVSNAALQSNISILKMNLSTKDVVLLNSQSEINRTIKATNDQERQVYKYLDIIKEMIIGNEGKMLENEARIVFKNWRPIRKEIFESVGRGEKEIAAAIIIGKGGRHVALLEAKMLGLTTYARKKASDFIHEADKAHSRLDVTLLSFLLLGVLISVQVVFFTIKWTSSAEGALRETEEALRKSKQIIEGIINAIPVRVFWKDKNLVYLGCNTLFAQDAGLADPKDIIGKDDYQMVWRDQAELYRGDDRQVIESGGSKLLVEEPQTTPEGKTITLLTSKLPLRSSKGEIIGVLGMYMDITERKQAEEELQRSHQGLPKKPAV